MGRDEAPVVYPCVVDVVHEPFELTQESHHRRLAVRTRPVRLEVPGVPQLGGNVGHEFGGFDHGLDGCLELRLPLRFTAALDKRQELVSKGIDPPASRPASGV